MNLWAATQLDSRRTQGAVDYLHRRAGRPSQPFGVYFVDALDPASLLGRQVELERFGAEFGNGASYLESMYGRFEQAGKTELILVVDHLAKQPAGVIRTVVNSKELGSVILNDLQSAGPNGWGLSMKDILSRSNFAAASSSEILEVATIAVARAYSGSLNVEGVSKALCAAVFQRSLARTELLTWVCSLARVPYLLIQAYTDGVMREFDGVPSRPYHGDEDTVPLWSNFREHEEYLRRKNPALWRRYACSEGLEKYFFETKGLI